MLRVKVFSSATHAPDCHILEQVINAWVDADRPLIRQMAQSATAERVVITFLYESGQNDAPSRAASAAVPEAFERSLDDAELDPADDEPALLPDAELPY